MPMYYQGAGTRYKVLGDEVSAEQAASQGASAQAEAESLRLQLEQIKKRQPPKVYEWGCGGGGSAELPLPVDYTTDKVRTLPEWWMERPKGVSIPSGFQVTLYDAAASINGGGTGRSRTWANLSPNMMCVDLVADGFVQSKNWGIARAFNVVDLKFQNMERMAKEKERIAETLTREAKAQAAILTASQFVAETAAPTAAAQAAKGKADIQFWEQQADIDAAKQLAEQAALRRRLSAQVEAEQAAAGQGGFPTGIAITIAAAAAFALVLLARKRRKG